MNKELKIKNKTRLFLATFVVVMTLFFSVGFVFAQDYGLSDTAGVAGLSSQYESDISVLIGNIIGVILSFVSVVFFGLMLYGGIRWMLARGNEEESKKALDTIIAAIIGIIIVIGSYAVTTFVLSSFTTGDPVGSEAGGEAGSGVVQVEPGASAGILEVEEDGGSCDFVCMSLSDADCFNAFAEVCEWNNDDLKCEVRAAIASARNCSDFEKPSDCQPAYGGGTCDWYDEGEI